MMTLASLALAVFMTFASGAEIPLVSSPSPEDFTIVSDSVAEGVRTIVAKPSALVCSSRMNIRVDVKTETILSVVFYGGCPGNTKAVANLLEGLTVRQAVTKLDGIPCGRRDTSCADQLSRVLKKSFGIKK